jgi:predicted GNAT superfamily acetyltransferase
VIGNVVIRRCVGIEESRVCLDLQKEVWGFSDIELVPLRLFVVAEKVGGQVIGAFEGETMVAFALAIPGNRNGHLYLHSHMLAVRESHRDRGLGRAVKLFQREDALARGIDLIEWTFDPLEIKNAYLNLEKLGAIARRYNINQYGITTSPLQGGLPTDRLVAEWWLRSKRVQAVLETGKHPPVNAGVKVAIPARIYEWKAKPDTRQRALELQTLNRDVFLKSFADGMACLGYERDREGNGQFLLGHWDEKWSYAE